MSSKSITSATLQILRECNNVPMCSVRSNALLLYNQYIGNRKSNQTTFINNHNLLNTTYSGEFTPSSKKSLSKAIEIINLLNPKTIKRHPISKRPFKHSLSFVTLTIPDDTRIHPTTAYNNLLRPFLQYLTKTHNCKSYIWKLEFQQRGQIHYHITTDLILHWKIIRDKWNYLINKNSLMTNYIAEHKHNNPNSSDIHKVYKIDNFVSYLQKEFIKKCQNTQPFSTWIPLSAATEKYRIWDCSTNIKKNNLFKFELDSSQIDFNNLITQEQYDLAYKKNYDNCSVIIPNGIKTTDLLTDENKSKFSQYLSTIRNEITIFTK